MCPQGRRRPEAHASLGSRSARTDSGPVEVPGDRLQLHLALARFKRPQAAPVRRADGAVLTSACGVPRPELPTFFNKQVSCITGPYDPILAPYDSPMLDTRENSWRSSETGAARRRRHGARVRRGLTVGNDVSVRDWQQDTPTMWRARASTPMGPSDRGSSRPTRLIRRVSVSALGRRRAAPGRAHEGDGHRNRRNMIAALSA